jgi:hypothetical protein
MMESPLVHLRFEDCIFGTVDEELIMGSILTEIFLLLCAFASLRLDILLGYLRQEAR